MSLYALLAIIVVCACVLILLILRPGILHLKVEAGEHRGAEIDYKPIADDQKPMERR